MKCGCTAKNILTLSRFVTLFNMTLGICGGPRKRISHVWGRAVMTEMLECFACRACSFNISDLKVFSIFKIPQGKTLALSSLNLLECRLQRTQHQTNRQGSGKEGEMLPSGEIFLLDGLALVFGGTSSSISSLRKAIAHASFMARDCSFNRKGGASK